MTRKAIEIQPWPVSVTPGEEYNPLRYPKDGLYLRTGSGLPGYVVVGGTVFSVVIPANCPTIDIPEELVAIPSQPLNTVSENTLLKAIALAQKPELAEKLCL